MQEMVIYGVGFDLGGKQPIVLLKAADGNKFLPIWIGHPEAAAILMKLQGASTPRPMTHDLVTDMLEQLDAQVVRITVTELKESTFYASITVQQNGSEVDIDSRPSDAIALAVRAEAPIFAADDVIEESAIEFEGEEVDEDQIVDEFKRFLDNVSPEEGREPRPVAKETPLAPDERERADLSREVAPGDRVTLAFRESRHSEEKRREHQHGGDSEDRSSRCRSSRRRNSRRRGSARPR